MRYFGRKATYELPSSAFKEREQGYACVHMHLGREWAAALSPSPQTRRRAPWVAGMSKRETTQGSVRELVLRVRCSESERAMWLRKARAQERSLSDYARHVLSAEPMQRRARPPEVDPVLLVAVGRAGNNLNQIARAMNTDRKAGRAIDLIAVRTLLMTLDRQLAEIVADQSR